MGLVDAVKSCFRQYVGFHGRAARSEFWFWQLFVFLTSIVLEIIGYSVPSLYILSAVFSLAVLLPSLAVGARRLHDIGRSGWWQLLYLIPLLGFVILVYWFVKRSAVGENAYGPNPLGDGNGLQDEVFAE